MKQYVCVLILFMLLSVFSAMAATDPFYGKDKINIVYFGGSITQGAGASSPDKNWASLVTAYFKSAYPDKEVSGINAGMGGTGSDMGLFRLNRDVIMKNPDVVFVEFAVNDRGSDPLETKKFMEGIVRQLQKSEQTPIIIFLYTTTDKFDACASVHQEVANYYGIPSIDLQAYIKGQVDAGKLDIAKILKDGVHPNDDGYKLYADFIIDKLKNHPSEYLKKPIKKDAPLVNGAYEFLPRFDNARNAQTTGNWRNTGSGISSETPGDYLTYKFSGPMLAIQNRISSYGGNCSIEIDGTIYKELSTYYGVSDQPVMWYKNMELGEGEHTLVIKVLDSKNEKSKGNRISIDYFIVNDGKPDGFAEDTQLEKSQPLDVSIDNFEGGIVFDTSYSGYTEEGIWTSSNLVGFKGNYLRYSDAPNAAATWDIKIQRDIYKLYYWHCMSVNGSTKGMIKASCTTGTQSKAINFQRGVAGWIEVGTMFISDGAVSVTISGEDGRVLASALKFVKADESLLNQNALVKKVPRGFILKIGSKKAFVNGSLTEVPGAAPIIRGGLTLVPLRFISEGFGADVSWDEAEKSAKITLGANSVTFKLNSALYKVNGEEKTLDQPPVIISGHMLLPVRALSESIGKQVFWDNRGLIIIDDNIDINVQSDKDLIDAGINALS